MGNHVIFIDDVRTVRVDGKTSRVRVRVVDLDDSTWGVLFSESRSGPNEGTQAGAPSPAVAALLEEAWPKLEELSTGRSLRWFEHIFGRSSTDGGKSQVIVEVLPGDMPRKGEEANQAGGQSESGWKIRTVQKWLTAQRKPVTFKSAEKLLGFPPSGVPFLIDQKVCPSSVGIETGLQPDLTATILRRIEPAEVVVEIGGKERTCPAMWFRLYFPPIKEKGRKSKPQGPPKAKPEPVQKFAVGEVVEFDAYNAGLGAHPEGKIIAAVSPDEDPMSILGEVLPDWKETHTLISPQARLSASADIFRYWVVAEPTEHAKRGRQPKTRLLLKREDWLGRKEKPQ